MDLELTDEQMAIRDTVRQFAQQRVLPRAAEIDETDEFPWDLQREAGELGLIGLEVPVEEGGAGADTVSVVLANEELAKVSVAVANNIGAAASTARTLATLASPAQRQRWLPGVLRGEIVGGGGITEPEAGSDVSSIRTRAVRDGNGGYILNGTKTLTSRGAVASFMTVLAYTDPTRGTRGGMTVFLVDIKQPGVTVVGPERLLGQKGTAIGTEYFEDVRLSSDDILGEEGGAFGRTMRNLDTARIKVAAWSLGLSEACFELARQYASERVQFGQPIANFQMVQQILADMAVEIEAMRLLAYKAALAFGKGGRSRKEVSMAKLFCSDHAMKHATECIQILGGYGYTKAYPAERYFRDAKVLQIYDGTSQIHRWIIARELMREMGVAPVRLS